MGRSSTRTAGAGHSSPARLRQRAAYCCTPFWPEWLHGTAVLLRTTVALSCCSPWSHSTDHLIVIDLEKEQMLVRLTQLPSHSAAIPLSRRPTSPCGGDAQRKADRKKEAAANLLAQTTNGLRRLIKEIERLDNASLAKAAAGYQADLHSWLVRTRAPNGSEEESKGYS